MPQVTVYGITISSSRPFSCRSVPYHINYQTSLSLMYASESMLLLSLPYHPAHRSFMPSDSGHWSRIIHFQVTATLRSSIAYESPTPTKPPSHIQNSSGYPLQTVLDVSNSKAGLPCTPHPIPHTLGTAVIRFSDTKY
jgi:hypothetical protein